MTTLPTWTSRELADTIAEPFRSDGQFWSSLAASADALASLAIATAVAVILGLTGQHIWVAVPFLVPVVLTIRAGVVSASSSRRSRAAFADRRAWRDAERAAVAAVFLKVLRRRRGVAR